MGQYYRTYIQDSKGNESVFSPACSVNYKTLGWEEPDAAEAWGYDFETGVSWNGMKLMEHSWAGNEYCRCLLNELVEDKDGYVVFHVGDYADEDGDWTPGYTRDIYDTVWDGDAIEFEACPQDEPTGKDGFIVNLDRCVYIDLEAYYNDLADLNDGWVIFPLTLLCAVGNGRGGGDFAGHGLEHVGEWAGDIIIFTYDRPEGMEESNIRFSELTEEERRRNAALTHQILSCVVYNDTKSIRPALCGREEMQKLIAMLGEAEPGTDFGDADTGMLNLENLTDFMRRRGMLE